MSWLSDDAVARLKAAANAPVFASGRYSVVRRIGRGGMGTVYEGLDADLGRAVAIKVTHAAGPDSALETRMRQEALMLAGLEHPGIVPIHDVGTLADGRMFVVMKLVQGTTLGATPGTLEERLGIFARIYEPVAFAHDRGCVHRDLKPANVMIGSFGEVLVMDWGLARFRQDGEAAPSGLSGTEGWMAPEQERGEAVDQRADVYALGKLLAMLLSGVRLPKRLQAIGARATAPSAGDRYRDAAALAADIQRFRAGQPVEAYPESIVDRAARLAVTYRTPLLLVLAYLVMRVVIALGFGR